MSTPLPQNCTDFQACQFFQGCKDQLRKIAQSHKLQTNIKKTMNKLKQTSSTSSTSTTDLERMLYNNIVVDYFRANKLDYTYSVFMRQCNIIAEQLVGKNKLAGIIGVQQQYNKDDRFDISLIQIMSKKLETLNKSKSQGKTQSGIQVEILKNSGQQNNILLFENKMRQIREQVQKRQKKYYEKQLQNMKAVQIMSLRNDIIKQFQQKYKLDKQKLNNKYKQLIQKSKNNENPSSLKQQNEKLLNKSYELSQQISKIKSQNEIMKKQKIKHDCRKSEDYKKLSQTLKQQKRQLQQKKKQLDFAIRNISTKVEDLVMQKKHAQSDRQSDMFMQQVKINKQNKDYMIETIHAQMRQMDLRVKILIQQNNQLRETVKALRTSIRNKQQQGQMREQSFINALTTVGNNYTNANAYPNSEYPSGDVSISSIQRRAYPKNANIEGNRNKQMLQTVNPLCQQCMKRKRKNINKQMINISVGVTQEDLIGQQDRQQQIQDSYQDDFEERMRKQLQHKKKLAKLKAQRNMLKKQTLLLVQDKF